MRGSRFRKWIRIGCMGLFIALLAAGTGLAAVKSEEKETDWNGTGPAAVKTVLEDTIAPEAVYNKEMGMYEHEFAGGRRIVSSVANGGQVSDAVFVSVPHDAEVTLELDGQPHAFVNGALLSDPGYYVMIVTSKQIGSNQNASAILRFRILNPPTGKLDTGEYVYPKVVSGLEKTTEKAGTMTLFVFPNKKGFLTDVPEDGATVTAASFYFPPGIGYQIYREGMPIALYNNKALRDSGRYQLKVYAESQAREGDYAACYEAVFNFTIPSNAEDLEAFSDDSGEKVTYQTISLKETYHDDLGLYEEVFENGNVFYSNVGGGSIVGGGAYLDIPQNVTVKMTVDGAEKPYLNKTVYDEEGTYYFTLSYQEQKNGTKTIYQSNFRFRIQKNAPSVPVSSVLSDLEQGETLPEETSSVQELPEETENKEDKEDKEAVPEESLFVPSDAAVQKKPVPEGQGFDYSQQLYYRTFEDGSRFFIGVPQNGISNVPVLVKLPEGGKGTVRMGENSVELPEAVSVNEDGTYHIEVTSAGGETLNWDFTVMGHGISNLTQLQAPDGYYIASIVKDGVPIEGAETAEYYELTADGAYTVSFLSFYEEYPEWFLAMTVDTQPPVLQFTGVDENGTATGKTIEYQADEKEVTVTVKKGKKVVKTYNNTITGSGTYVITAEDAAGNQTTYEIKIPFKADKITVLLVVLVWLLALGFVIYYKLNARKVRVR